MRGRGSLTLVHVRGIPVRLHFTFLIVLPYLTWVIARTSPTLAELAGLEVGTLALPTYALGAILALGLFFCVLVHEFGHVFVGLLGGARFSGVTLMLVGGVSEVVELPQRPLHEAAMALAGPVTSLLLAALAYLGYALADLPDLRFGLFYLAYVNLALAIFNMLPAFPMDGGRILRALLALVTTRVKATRAAAWIGQGMAVLFLLGGVFSFNLVLLLIGILVVGGARAELEMVRSNSAMEGLKVEQAMQVFAPTVEGGDRISTVIERMRRELKTTYFVLSPQGEFLGAITAAEAQRVEENETPFLRVEERMRRDVPSVRPDQDLAQAARELRSSGLSMLPVMRDRDLVGCLSFASIAGAVRERDKQKLAGLRESEAT